MKIRRQAKWLRAVFRSSRTDVRLIPIAVGLVLILGLVAAAATTVYLSRQAEISRAERELSRVSLTLAEQTGQMVQMADQILIGIAEQLKTGDAESVAEFRQRIVTEQIHTMLRDKVRDTPNLNALTLVAGDGYMVNFSRRWPVNPVRVDDRSYFTALRDNPDSGPFISEPIRNRANHNWTIFLARRLNGPHREFLGVLLAAIETRYFEALYARVAPGDEATISLFRSDGTLLARHPDTDASIGRSFGASQLFTRVMANADRGVMHTDASAFDGLARIMTPHAVQNYPLIINVTNLTSAILADWRRQAITIGVLTAAAMLLVLLSGCLVVQAIGLQQKMARSQMAKVRAEQARIAAEKANAAKTRFLANMSHELRTPLNAIIGFAEMTRDAVVAPLDLRYREYASDIVSSGRHLLNVINDVLDMAKSEVGRLKLNKDDIQLADLLDECRRLFVLAALNSQLTLEVTVQPGLPPVSVDPLRLKQALLNLISNAVKFSPPGASVRISAASSSSGGIVVAIADTGIGMSGQDALHALQPFYQVDNSMTRRYEGTGLGLPIAKRLIELHGGTLTIKSAPRQGTTVTIELPPTCIARPQPAVAASAIRRAPAAS